MEVCIDLVRGTVWESALYPEPVTKEIADIRKRGDEIWAKIKLTEKWQ